ncbi:hypothetical protein VE02_09623, partial [Pseudogymnoascus sp. 03VT05]
MWPLSKNHSSKISSSKQSGPSKTNGSSKNLIPQTSSKPGAPSKNPMPPHPPSARPGSSSAIPIPETTTPRQTTSGRTPPASTHPPLSQRHQYPPQPPPLQQQQQEYQLLQPQQQPPRPDTPPQKRSSGGSTLTKLTSGAKTPTTLEKGHGYTSSGGSGGSTPGFGRWGRRSLPSPPDSLAGNGEAGTGAAGRPGDRRSWGTEEPGQRRSWGAAGTGGLGAEGGAAPAPVSEQRRSWGAGNGERERGIGRVAARIKAA